MSRFLLVAALWFTGCVFHKGQNGAGEDPEHPRPPGASPATSGIPQSFGDSAARLGGNVRLTVVNLNAATVCRVFISPSNEENWGTDWLGPEEVVPSGSSRIFGVLANSYDVKVTTCAAGQPERDLGEIRGVAVQGDTPVEVR